MQLSNYSSFEGVLYCKPHFNQLFKITGSLDKSFEGTPKTVRTDRSADQVTNSKVSNMFTGTQERQSVAVDGTSYHKACFRCIHGGCVISPSNYVVHEHRLFCRHHHNQLFKQKGNISQLDKHEEAKGVTENTVA
ncbi:hypothetical protein GQ457_11G033510 [Hibiscus cannabinus]